MKNKKLYDWIATGVKWYFINVAGGILSIVRYLGWLLHDVWCKIRHVDHEEEYIIDKSSKKLGLGTMTILMGMMMILM